MAEHTVDARHKNKPLVLLYQWLSPLLYSNLRAFICACTLSKLGDYIFKSILAWYILDTTGSVLQMGYVLIGSSIPSIILLPISGVLLDRFSKKSILFCNNLLQALAVISLAFIVHLSYFNIHLFFWGLAFIGTLEVLANPAMSSYLPELLPDKSLLHATNSLNLLGGQLSSILGPLLGAYFFKVVGVSGGILINSFTFVAFCLLIYPVQSGQVPSKRIPKKNLIVDISQGFDYMKNVPWLFWALLIILVQNSVNSGVWAIGVPAIVKLSLQNNIDLMARIYAIGAVGSVSGLCIAGISKPNKKRGFFLIGSVMTCSHALWLMSTGNLILIYLAGFMRGFALAFFHLPWNTIFMEKIKESERGKVFSLFTMSSLCFVPIGMGLSGIVAEYFGSINLFSFSSFILLLLAILMLLNKPIRTLD